MSTHDIIRVELDARSYEILAGDALLSEAGRHIAPVLKQNHVFIVTDENVAALHLETVQRSLDDAGISYESLVLPAGDQTKGFAYLQKLIGELLSRRVERDSTVIALGGGVIGDLAGFAAAITLRGIDYVQIPTTLLAQVDSSVGGKTAINTEHGKNLVGMFHQPRLVLADIGVLDTLPQREFLAGYAEVVKYGLINDSAFFTWLEGHGAALREGDRAGRRKAVVKSCQAKADIVAADERETGQRALLNLGHTFGHALEAETGYSDMLLHGEGVAIGAAMAFDLSARMGLCSTEDAARVHRHFAAMGLSTGLDHLQGVAWQAEDLMAHMGRDKKVRGGRMTFVLVKGIGQAFLSQDVAPEDLVAILEDSVSS
ncbi:MAG: 3-dehydroquinate synthase [Alphaproteobacteria bacterium]|nr:3-dehydroquinate synthase [Alphaproteobacteria bacterium]